MALNSGYSFHKHVLAVPVGGKNGQLPTFEYRQNDDCDEMVLLSLLRHFQLHGEEKLAAWDMVAAISPQYSALLEKVVSWP